MLSRDAIIIGGRVKTVNWYLLNKKKYIKDTGLGTKEEEDRLRQMKINMETARRQGDQDTVKEIKEAIEELEASIRRSTTSDVDIEENKGYADVEIDEPTQALLTLFSSDQIINDHEVFHILAEKLGMDPSELEEKAYAMLQSFFSKGKSSESNNIPDPIELAMGDRVELEHTSSPLFARKIALDHIAEIPNYYTLLAQIEKSETKDSDSERTFQTYEAWRSACKKIDPNVKFDGDIDICQAGHIGEWDGARGIIYFTDSKTKDASPLLTCKHCKSTFALDNVISHMKKFNKDRSFMTTKHCPNCDKRISLRDENPDVEAAKKRIILLNKYGAQCRMNGNREEYDKALSEIKELDALIANIREGKSL